MKAFKHVIFAVSVLMFSFFSFGINGSASELNFAVEPILPKNQISAEHSYFDLKINPGDKQRVYVNLRNDTEDSVDIAIGLDRATTNLTGVVQYSETEVPVKENMDKSFTNNITDLIKFEPNVTIKPKTTEMIPLDIEMPKESFQGVVSGGLTFRQTNRRTNKTNNQTNVNNDFAYTVGINLQNTTTSVKPNLELTSIIPKQINYRTAIVVKVNNVTPVFINNVSIDGVVSSKSSKKPVLKVKELVDKEHFGKQIAPNSIYSIPFYLDGQELKSGEYTLDLKMSSHGHTWHFTETFNIEATDAEKFNKTDVSINKFNWWIIAGIVLVLILLIIYYLWKKYRKSK